MSNAEELLWLREFIARDAAELMHRYGAHSVGIGRLAPGDDRDDRLALLFYRSPDGPESGSAEPVPPEMEYLPDGRSEPVNLPTRVVESAPVEFE